MDDIDTVIDNPPLRFFLKNISGSDREKVENPAILVRSLDSVCMAAYSAIHCLPELHGVLLSPIMQPFLRVAAGHQRGRRRHGRRELAVVGKRVAQASRNSSQSCQSSNSFACQPAATPRFVVESVRNESGLHFWFGTD